MVHHPGALERLLVAYSVHTANSDQIARSSGRENMLVTCASMRAGALPRRLTR